MRRQLRRGTLIATYCSGSFMLAEAGLLDGQAATTHWAKASAFKKRYPKVDLRAGAVMTEQDGILCSGAVHDLSQPVDTPHRAARRRGACHCHGEAASRRRRFASALCAACGRRPRGASPTNSLSGPSTGWKSA